LTGDMFYRSIATEIPAAELPEIRTQIAKAKADKLRLIVPASVDYRLNLNELTLADVEYDENAKLVRVDLPKLKLSSVAFYPEQATTTNGGILTFDEDKVQALNKRAYATARRAITAQAQQRAMVDVAKRKARENVEEFFEIPLRIAGHPDVKVVATFD